jgi:TonB family protein
VALAVKEEGTVTLEATIDEAGNVKNLKVIGSRPLLDKAAIEAVSKWRYTPTRLNGVAVPIIPYSARHVCAEVAAAESLKN